MPQSIKITLRARYFNGIWSINFSVQSNTAESSWMKQKTIQLRRSSFVRIKPSVTGSTCGANCLTLIAELVACRQKGTSVRVAFRKQVNLKFN